MVAPAVVAVPQIAPEELQRVPPRPPLSKPAPAQPPRARPKPLLFRPVADSAGVILAGGRRLIIAGVEPLPHTSTCPRSGGGEWPCGNAARAAFRGFLRGRAITCDFPPGEVPGELTVACSVGNRDIGAWLVGNGWARAGDDTYLAEARAAREAGRGIYGPGPAEPPPLPSAEAALGGETAAIGGAPLEGAHEERPEAAEGGPESISILPPAVDPDGGLSGTGDAATADSGQSAPTAPPAAGSFPEVSPPPAGGLSPLPPPSSPLQ